MVGHTHEDLDQLLAMICQYVTQRHRWHTPEEVQRLGRETMSDTLEAKHEVLVVQGLRSFCDYNTWLEPQNVELHGCWGHRDGLEAPHSFAFKKRRTSSAEERAQVQRR